MFSQHYTLRIVCFKDACKCRSDSLWYKVAWPMLNQMDSLCNNALPNVSFHSIEWKERFWITNRLVCEIRRPDEFQASFLINLNTVFTGQLESVILRMTVNEKIGKLWKKRLRLTSRYYPSIFLQELRERRKPSRKILSSATVNRIREIRNKQGDIQPSLK